VNYGINLRRYFPQRKATKTVCRPVVPYRKVLDSSLHIENWMSVGSASKNVLGSVCDRRFQEWIKLDIFKKTWIKLLKVYDEEICINWTWQSIDCISKVTIRGTK
jgi:hypothetical protein